MSCAAYLVDSFTDRAFAGNPAGVVVLDTPADPGWMQAVAAELRHSETAFVEPPDGSGARRLRWFTPTAEVELCGHATLATAHVLGGDQRFVTHSGELRCTAAGGEIEMDFPADPPRPMEPDIGVLGGLPGVTIVAVTRGVSDVVVEARDAAEVRAVRPDYAAIAGVPARGVIVTAPGDRAGIDIVSRCFYPAYGIPEDPVTGSAHCTLVSYWAGRLGADLRAEQASPRGGLLRVRLGGDRVRLSGRAVTVMSGRLSPAAGPAPSGH